MKNASLLTAILFFLLVDLRAQVPSLTIKKAIDEIKIDGDLDEASWKAANLTEPFTQNFPFDTSLAQMQTHAKMTFDDAYLYISAVCYQPRKYIVQSLKRDFQNGSSDIFFVTIDPFQDKLNGFYFAVSPYNIQKEALLFNGNDLNAAWDNKWHSAVKNYDDYWTVEMAIPFKTLRYKIKGDLNTWNINFCRNNLLINERSTWAPIPRNFRLLDLAFNGLVKWADVPPPPGTNIALIPYVSGAVGKDFVKGTPSSKDFQVGGDAKIGVTPSLNLDITVNPDFAQVEVDRQITNLSRFEIFFPERRQFFIENSDLFGDFGFAEANPFFSRRIGLARSPLTGQTVKVPITAGARLSGRLNKDWRIGLINMQTGKSEEFGTPSSNFAVAALQRRVFTRSSLGFIMVNKNDFYKEKDTAAYNRIIGTDFNMASPNGRWNGKFFYHQAITPNTKRDQFSTAGRINYNAPGFYFADAASYIGENFKADVGYVPRRGIVRNEGSVGLTLFAKGALAKTVNSFRVGPEWDVYYGTRLNKITDWDAGLYGRLQFQNSAIFNFTLFRKDFTYLTSSFDPTNTNGTPLNAGTEYHYNSTRIGFSSNQRKNFYYNIQTRFGQYFNGDIYNVQSTINYRWQPIGIFSIDANYTKINLPAPHNSRVLYLIGPRVDLSFSKSVFFSTFLQYNNQINNFNINGRFQWRFKPVSDFFIVYTDNYFATDDGNLGFKAFQTKNRAVVAKLTYWLNM